MTKLKVSVRVRPMSESELNNGAISVVDVENGDTLAVTNVKVAEGSAGDSRERVRRFTFDCCFQETATQLQVFEAIEDDVSHSVKQRFHSCVLAYGQSASGKTHTMMGQSEDPGLIPLLCNKVFDYIQQSAVGDEVECMPITVSYLEIYNEKVRDLLECEQDNLTGSRKKLPLKIREHPKKGPYVQGLSEQPAKSASDLLSWLSRGNLKRRVAATASNRLSSRSHSVFCISFGGGKLSLIDLAGSERTGCRHSDNISRFKEGANINKSLVALGNVISALAEHSSSKFVGPQSKVLHRRRFIPYRDSVLTWLLKDTLGGNSNTVMVATVSPSSSCYNETINTVRFGQRAKLIVCRPVVHEDPKERTIRELRAEILRLRVLLEGKIPYSLHQHQMNLSTHVATSDFPSGNLPNDNENVSNVYNKDTKENTELIDVLITSERKIDEIKNINCISQEDQEIISTTTTEKLLPLIEVKTIRPNRPTQLRRTFSVDHSITKMEREKLRKLGSNDSIPSTSTSSLKSTASVDKESLPSPKNNLRRVSLNKSIQNLAKTKHKSLEPKVEKAVSTEHLALKNIVSKVDSRRRLTKPRSQIVAAVTTRLYSKIKKKEATTDTDDINTYDLENPKDSSICANARLRLRDLTRRALKAHRNKTVETQTDFIPLRRVKESSTDVSDLKIFTASVAEVGTMSEINGTKDVSTNCNLFEDSSVHMTRTCGTQSGDLENEEIPPQKQVPKGVSFTKYLREIPNQNPIYAHSFNINISNNYMNGNRVSTSTSEDSLDDLNKQNIGLPTPDLLSNHNSLEPHSSEVHPSYGTIDELEENFNSNEAFIYLDKLKIFNRARACIIPNNSKAVARKNMPKTHAPEIVLTHNNAEEFCLPLARFNPERAVPRVIVDNEIICGECVKLREPVVLKSIVKETPRTNIFGVSSSEEEVVKTETLDSLDYHMANKKVKFREKSHPENQRMFRAMSSFLEEATQLMSKIDRLAAPATENDYNLEVTVNNLEDWRKCPKKHMKKRARSTGSSQTESFERIDNYNQTYPIFMRNSSTQYDFDYNMPINKYESVLEDSCRRLEEKISSMPSLNRYIYNEPQSFEYHHQDTYNTDAEESSLESTPITFSDYGSLPRRTHKRYRRPTCSPSAFLRQLTDMRKQIIQSSREDLLNNSCNHF